MIPDLVSCVIPTYNGERFIGQAIESILSQAYKHYEIICVDDGSTDATASVVQAFGDRVQYVYQDNAGPATARNSGTRIARGEFLAFLDSDDIWELNKLEVQVAYLRSNPIHGFCVTHVQNFWEAEVAEEHAKFQDHVRAKPVAGYVTQALLVRNDVFKKVGPFNTQLKHTDAAEWFMRAKASGVTGHLLDEVLVMRRFHKDNRSRKFAGRSRDEFLQMAMMAIKHKG